MGMTLIMEYFRIIQGELSHCCRNDRINKRCVCFQLLQDFTSFETAYMQIIWQFTTTVNIQHERRNNWIFRYLVCYTTALE